MAGELLDEICEDLEQGEFLSFVIWDKETVEDWCGIQFTNKQWSRFVHDVFYWKMPKKLSRRITELVSDISKDWLSKKRNQE